MLACIPSGLVANRQDMNLRTSVLIHFAQTCTHGHSYELQTKVHCLLWTVRDKAVGYFIGRVNLSAGGNMMLIITAVMFGVLHSMRVVRFC